MQNFNAKALINQFLQGELNKWRIQYAKVAVYSLPDSILINETTTDEHGEFAFTNVYSVNKMMKVTVDGYKETAFRALPEQDVKLWDSLLGHALNTFNFNK